MKSYWVPTCFFTGTWWMTRAVTVRPARAAPLGSLGHSPLAISASIFATSTEVRRPVSWRRLSESVAEASSHTDDGKITMGVIPAIVPSSGPLACTPTFAWANQFVPHSGSHPAGRVALNVPSAADVAGTLGSVSEYSYLVTRPRPGACEPS